MLGVGAIDLSGVEGFGGLDCLLEGVAGYEVLKLGFGACGTAGLFDVLEFDDLRWLTVDLDG